MNVTMHCDSGDSDTVHQQKQLGTAFSIDGIMSNNDTSRHQPHRTLLPALLTSGALRLPVVARRLPAFVRPWEMSTTDDNNEDAGITYMRLSAAAAAALTLQCYQWPAMMCNVSPLYALYKMTNSSFSADADSVGDDRFQGD